MMCHTAIKRLVSVGQEFLVCLGKLIYFKTVTKIKMNYYNKMSNHNLICLFLGSSE